VSGGALLVCNHATLDWVAPKPGLLLSDGWKFESIELPIME
jgi:hypothetical protein